MHSAARCGFTDFDGAYDVRVLYALSETGFAEETGDCRLVGAELLSKNFDRNRSVRRMFCTKDRRRAALAHFSVEGVASNSMTYEIFTWHGANLTAAKSGGKQMLNHSARAPFMMPRTLQSVVAGACCSALAACAGTPIQAAPQLPPRSAAAEAPAAESLDPYRRAGLLVGEGSLPFVATSAYFATESPDTTVILVGLSIPPRALSFVRAGDRYAAFYSVKLDFRSG